MELNHRRDPLQGSALPTELSRQIGALPWIRTRTSQFLKLLPLPVGVLARGASRQIRTVTVKILSLPSPANWTIDACGLASGSRTHSDRFRKSNTVHRPRDIGRLERSRTATSALRRREAESIGEAKSGADDRNRTGLCFVGNDADHLDRIRIWLLHYESNVDRSVISRLHGPLCYGAEIGRGYRI